MGAGDVVLEIEIKAIVHREGGNRGDDIDGFMCFIEVFLHVEVYLSIDF